MGGGGARGIGRGQSVRFGGCTVSSAAGRGGNRGVGLALTGGHRSLERANGASRDSGWATHKTVGRESDRCQLRRTHTNTHSHTALLTVSTDRLTHSFNPFDRSNRHSYGTGRVRLWLWRRQQRRRSRPAGYMHHHLIISSATEQRHHQQRESEPPNAAATTTAPASSNAGVDPSPPPPAPQPRRRLGRHRPSIHSPSPPQSQPQQPQPPTAAPPASGGLRRHSDHDDDGRHHRTAADRGDGGV